MSATPLVDTVIKGTIALTTADSEWTNRNHVICLQFRLTAYQALSGNNIFAIAEKWQHAR